MIQFFSGFLLLDGVTIRVHIYLSEIDLLMLFINVASLLNHENGLVLVNIASLSPDEHWNSIHALSLSDSIFPLISSRDLE